MGLLLLGVGGRREDSPLVLRCWLDLEVGEGSREKPPTCHHLGQFGQVEASAGKPPKFWPGL